MNALLRGVVRAGVMTAVAAIAFNVFDLLWPTALVVKSASLVLAALYVLDLARAARPGGGRAVVPALWLAGALASFCLMPGLGPFMLCQVALLWLVRVWSHHTRVLPALLELVLMLAALGSAIATARHTHSFALSVWVFFLVHTLGAHVPAWLAPAGLREELQQPEARFERAWRQADAAVRRLRAAD